MKNQSKYQRLWATCVWLERVLNSQASPYYYSRYEVRLQSTIEKVNFIIKVDGLCGELLEILQRLSELEKKFELNHPYYGLIGSEKFEEVSGKRLTTSKILENVKIPLIGWRRGPEKLEHLFNRTTNGVLFACKELRDFIPHFLPTGMVKSPPIRIIGSLTEFIQLINKMHDKGIIPIHKDYLRVICYHFADRNGNSLKKSSLSVLRSRKLKGPSEQFILLLIAELLAS